MAHQPKPVWNGPILVEGIAPKIDVRLVATQNRSAREYTVTPSHRKCGTNFPVPEKSRRASGSSPKMPTDPAALAPLEGTRQLFCTSKECDPTKPVTADEIVYRVELLDGSIEIMESLVPKKKYPTPDYLRGKVIKPESQLLRLVGSDHYYYALPKRGFLESYSLLYEALRLEDRAILLPNMVIQGEPEIGILRPVVVDKALFQQPGESRRIGQEVHPVLQIDILRDVSRLKDLTAHFPKLTATSRNNLRQLRDALQNVTRPVSLREVLNRRDRDILTALEQAGSNAAAKEKVTADLPAP